MNDIPEPVPTMPEAVVAEQLRELDDSALDAIVTAAQAAERATIMAMAPYDRQIRELRSRIAEVATERRRRERSAKQAARKDARAQAASGEMPALADALSEPTSNLPDATNLGEVAVFLRTGGEVRLGFPGRPGPTAFTDGRQVRNVTTWGEARALYAAGWEPGTAQVPGVRVHLLGTKVERVVTPFEVVVAIATASEN